MSVKLRLTCYEKDGLFYFTTNTKNSWPCVIFKGGDRDKAIAHFETGFKNYINHFQLTGHWTFH